MNTPALKISLAIIAGNVEGIIERFLDAFSPVADEIVIILAHGAAPPDRTRERIQEWWRASEKCRSLTVREYTNSKHPDWEHVDDFGAARQLAWEWASGEWIMWADTDDMISPESCHIIRHLVDEAEKRGCDGISLPYEIPEQNIPLFWERIVRRGRARWQSPVHECLESIDGKPLRLMQVSEGASIVHMPPRGKVSTGRNLRILESIPEEERTTSHRYHLFTELHSAQRLGEAAQAGIAFVQDPAAGPVEKHEVLLQMSQMADQLPTVLSFLQMALHLIPQRREALAELSNLSLGMGDLESAEAYATMMQALPEPADAPWTLRRKFYGWAGLHVLTHVLRAKGDFAKADALEWNHFREHGAKISLLHATRGRPQQAVRARALWLDRAKDANRIEHIFAFDLDDEASAPLSRFRHVCIGEADAGPVGAWNAAARMSGGEVLIQMSDDWDPPLHWDEIILERIGDTSQEAVLRVSDGHRTDGLLCMAILTRKRWKQQERLMFHPRFFSMYSDNFFTWMADRDEVIIDASDVEFRHLHPVFGEGQVDATYERSNARGRYDHGLQVYSELLRSWESCRGWFDFQSLYREEVERAPAVCACVEVGCAYGRSTVFLAKEVERSGKDIRIWVVDTFKGSVGEEGNYSADMARLFSENIERCGLQKMIEGVIVGESVESSECFGELLQFVFLDASHDYASVFRDLRAWWPKIAPGGTLAGHDFAARGVRDAVHHFFAGNAEAVGSCWRVRKPQSES